MTSDISVSVIGYGNQGSAVVKGLHESGGYSITVCDRNPPKLEDAEAYASTTTTETSEAGDSKVVVLSVKPGDIGGVLDEIDLSSDQSLVSFAAGVRLDFLEDRTDAKVYRVMPNLAAENREMAAAVASNVGMTPELRHILEDLGSFVEVDESLMDAATAINGSGPAFVFYLIKAMAEAGVESGFEDEDAERLAAQTFKGAAETVMRHDGDLEDLIDAVCSPGGTTIEGMKVLRDSDVSQKVGEAVEAAEERSVEISDEIQNG
ncbi:pyrroline-5-carboxylate reductase [Halorutilales archaeon Cl-col2-1]